MTKAKKTQDAASAVLSIESEVASPSQVPDGITVPDQFVLIESPSARLLPELIAEHPLFKGFPSIEKPALLEAGNATSPGDTLFRVGTLHGLIGLSLYAGIISVAELALHGDFGLGTYHGLDGEMIAVDGLFYQALSNGMVLVADPEVSVPFALLTHFKAQAINVTTQKYNFQSLEAYLSDIFPDLNRSYAFKIYGTFKDLFIRAVSKQTEPYTTDIQAAGFAMENINSTGTLVGFRFPSSNSMTTGDGYHFHFVSDDKEYGGHVLNFELNAGATIEAQVLIREVEGFSFQPMPIQGIFFNPLLTK